MHILCVTLGREKTLTGRTSQSSTYLADLDGWRVDWVATCTPATTHGVSSLELKAQALGAGCAILGTLQGRAHGNLGTGDLFSG